MSEDPPSMTGTQAEKASPCAPGLLVDVSMGDGFWSDSIEDVEAFVQGIIVRAWPLVPVEKAESAELSIRLTDDTEIAYLNQIYRGKEGPTNVLSFPASDRHGGPVAALGDVVLACETIVREAQEQSKPFSDHLAHLLVHGILHLRGFDHESEADAEEMEVLERHILAVLGIPDPYSDEVMHDEEREA